MSRKAWSKMTAVERQLARLRADTPQGGRLATVAGVQVMVSRRRGYDVIGGPFARHGLGLEQAARWIRVVRERRGL